MFKFSSLLAAALLLPSSLAWSEDDNRSVELRYCLDLPTYQQIAKCAGEISAGNKKQTFSRKEVDKILSGQKASTPVSGNEPSVTPAPVSEPEPSGTPASVNDTPEDILLSDKPEHKSN